ncbi:MAG: PLDc N-terminal domain-containing protein [Acidobacteriia bacterium]|nr:PLDc N-terminal domain-containing protein [Terriglobia bacterium]
MDGVGFPEVLLIFVFVIVILGTAFWIWMLVECATKEPDTGNSKVVWVIIIVFTNLIGAAIYYFVRRPQRWKELGR